MFELPSMSSNIDCVAVEKPVFDRVSLGRSVLPARQIGLDDLHHQTCGVRSRRQSRHIRCK